MQWLRRWVRGRRARRRAAVRRMIVLEIGGLEPALVGALLTEGLLPNLALLRDIGTLERLSGDAARQFPVDWQSVASTLSESGVRCQLLPTRNVSVKGDEQAALLSPVIAADKQ